MPLCAGRLRCAALPVLLKAEGAEAVQPGEGSGETRGRPFSVKPGL